MQFSTTSRLCRIAMIASSYALVRVDVGGWVGGTKNLLIMIVVTISTLNPQP